jgi:putative hemolysin
MELLILLLLVVLNGVFAMAEMSIVASRKARLQQWSNEGRAGADAALALAVDPGHFLSTTQIGITAIGIVSGAFAGATVARQLAGLLGAFAVLQPYADTLALVVVVAGITVGSLVIGELVPKRIALLHPEAIASAVARPMRWLTRLVFPLVKAMSLATDAALRLFGSNRAGEPPVSQEEIRVLMQQGAAAGVFEAHEQAMVSRVFRMDERRVTSVMTPRVDARFLDLDVSFEVNRETLLGCPYSRFPLCHGGLDTIIGIVHAKGLLEDALKAVPFDLGRNASRPLFVPDGLTIAELLETFKKHRSHLALVVDEYGEIQGLVTMTDVMEALVGDIGTAGEEPDSDVVRRDDGSWLVDGAVPVQRMKEIVGLETAVPEEHADSYTTLGGFVMMQLRRMPRVGDAFEAGGHRFEVVDMDRNRVDRLLISRVKAAPAGKTDSPRPEG